jgi:hypothetical protein
MTDELKTAIEALKAVSPKLNKKTDEIDALVQRVESFLNEECSIGIEQSVFFDRDEIEKGELERYLKYTRCSGGYRLAISECTYEYDLDEDGSRIQTGYAGIYEKRLVNEEVKPWSECGRALKLRAFPSLPQLIAQIAKKANDYLESTEKATETVKQVLRALNSKS